MKRTLFLITVLVATSALALFAKTKKINVNEEIANLYNENEGVQNRAVARLIEAGPDAIPRVKEVVCNQSNPSFETAWPAAAKVLAELKAGDAAYCIVPLLARDYPPIGPPMMKPDETLINVDPAFASLIKMGNSAVPALRRRLPFLDPDQSMMALRILRKIGTAEAREAAESYVKFLDDQTRFARQTIADFPGTPDQTKSHE